jgi:hypothetical protein
MKHESYKHAAIAGVVAIPIVAFGHFALLFVLLCLHYIDQALGPIPIWQMTEPLRMVMVSVLSLPLLPPLAPATLPSLLGNSGIWRAGGGLLVYVRMRCIQRK